MPSALALKRAQRRSSIKPNSRPLAVRRKSALSSRNSRRYSAREYVYPDNLWTPFAPRLEVVEVPGDHDAMVLEPNVRVLAARMKAAIQAAEAGDVRHPDHRLAAE